MFIRKSPLFFDHSLLPGPPLKTITLIATRVPSDDPCVQVRKRFVHEEYPVVRRTVLQNGATVGRVFRRRTFGRIGSRIFRELDKDGFGPRVVRDTGPVHCFSCVLLNQRKNRVPQEFSIGTREHEPGAISAAGPAERRAYRAPCSCTKPDATIVVPACFTQPSCHDFSARFSLPLPRSAPPAF